MRGACQLALALLLFSSCAAAQSPDKESASQPAVLSAEALEYGAELAEHASDELRDWAQDYVEDNLRWHDPDLPGTVGAVEETFSGSDGGMRNAVAYMVMYLAYRDQQELEHSFVRDLRLYASEAEQIAEDLEIWQRYVVPLAAVVARPSGNGLADQEENRMVARIGELKTKSRMRSNQLRRIRGRIGFYLQVLNAAHEQLPQIPPERLAPLRPRPPE